LKRYYDENLEPVPGGNASGHKEKAAPLKGAAFVFVGPKCAGLKTGHYTRQEAG